MRQALFFNDALTACCHKRNEKNKERSERQAFSYDHIPKVIMIPIPKVSWS